MQISVDRTGKSKVKLTKTEVQFLRKASAVTAMLADHCQRESSLAKLAADAASSLDMLLLAVTATDPLLEAAELEEHAAVSK
jgi:hypothetical protein